MMWSPTYKPTWWCKIFILWCTTALRIGYRCKGWRSDADVLGITSVADSDVWGITSAADSDVWGISSAADSYVWGSRQQPIPMFGDLVSSRFLCLGISSAADSDVWGITSAADSDVWGITSVADASDELTFLFRCSNGERSFPIGRWQSIVGISAVTDKSVHLFLACFNSHIKGNVRVSGLSGYLLVQCLLACLAGLLLVSCSVY